MLSSVRAALFALLAIPLVAHGTEVDTTFGSGGSVSFAFQPNEQWADDQAVVACPGPLGSLVVSGFASTRGRIVTVWLTENGELDTRFSGDGKHSLAIPENLADGAVGLCHPSGRIVIAFNVARGGDDGATRVTSLDPFTGVPDASFGDDGFVLVDLDDYDDALDRQETINEIGLGADDDLIVSGSYDRDGTEYGHLIRVSIGGITRRVVLGHRFAPEVGAFHTVGLSADGELWALGSREMLDSQQNEIVEVSVRALDAASFDERRVLHEGFGDRYEPIGGRMIDGGTLLFAGRYNDSVAFFRVSRDRVDRAALGALGTLPLAASIVPWPPHRPTVAITSGASSYEPTLYSRLLIPALDGVQIDRSFGIGGIERVAPATPTCTGGPAVTRLTNWSGRVTAAGSIYCGQPAGSDYLVTRLANSYLFGDGFE